VEDWIVDLAPALLAELRTQILAGQKRVLPKQTLPMLFFRAKARKSALTRPTLSYVSYFRILPAGRMDGPGGRRLASVVSHLAIPSHNGEA
jgi:hypothetical protein